LSEDFVKHVLIVFNILFMYTLTNIRVVANGFELSVINICSHVLVLDNCINIVTYMFEMLTL